VFHSPRFYSILASMASLTLALLSLLHFILHVNAFLDLIPRDLWVLSKVFLLPAEGGSGVICRDFNLKVYAIIASVLGFISYTMLYYMISLGLLTLASFRYKLLLLYILGLIILCSKVLIAVRIMAYITRSTRYQTCYWRLVLGVFYTVTYRTGMV
jgi:hypothetical protein